MSPRTFLRPPSDNGVGTHTITGLTAEKSYRVRLRAENDEGDGAWSSWETQSTNKEGNDLPTFTSSSDPTRMWYLIRLYVVENAPSARQPLTRDASAGVTVASIQKEPTVTATRRLPSVLKAPARAGSTSTPRQGR